MLGVGAGEGKRRRVGAPILLCRFRVTAGQGLSCGHWHGLQAPPAPEGPPLPSAGVPSVSSASVPTLSPGLVAPEYSGSCEVLTSSPKSGAAHGTGSDLWTRERPMPPLSRPSQRLGTEGQQCQSHREPSGRSLPPASQGRCTCGRGKQTPGPAINPESAHLQLCEAGQVSEPLWASVSYSVKGDDKVLASRADRRFQRR